MHISYQQEKQDYEKRVQERIGSDRYASRHAQTVNWALKTKEVGQIGYYQDKVHIEIGVFESWANINIASEHQAAS